MATSVDIIIINKDSFPDALWDRAFIPAVKAPVLFIIPIVLLILLGPLLIKLVEYIWLNK